MPPPSSRQITKIRAASRDLVRELGFMNRTIGGTDLSASAVHALIEIGANGRLSSRALSEKLILEKSTISRLIKSLVDRGEVREVRSDQDGRSKDLLLTAQGEKTVSAIARFAERQVGTAINPLSHADRDNIVSGLAGYSAALRASRMSGDADAGATREPLPIDQGYTPGIIGCIVEMHASHYSKLVNFGAAFETKVAAGLAEFATRLDADENAIWHADHDGRVVGSIAIDGQDLGNGKAHLRWFIVDPDLRGTGLGKSLIRQATQFCDEREFRETHLWTLKGLEAARSLYESHGFVLAEEYYGDQWGNRILEQRFVRPHRG